jgi:hypothetical protein
MTVAACMQCGCFISISLLPTGNPVAKKAGWATKSAKCSRCRRYICDGCVAKSGGKCPSCNVSVQIMSFSDAADEVLGRGLDYATPDRHAPQAAWDLDDSEEEAPKVFDIEGMNSWSGTVAVYHLPCHHAQEALINCTRALDAVPYLNRAKKRGTCITCGKPLGNLVLFRIPQTADEISRDDPDAIDVRTGQRVTRTKAPATIWAQLRRVLGFR